MTSTKGLSAGVLRAALGVVSSLGLAVWLGWNRIVSGSVDMTYHLQVLDVVRPGGPVPASAQAFMAEMYGYPDLGHRIAALLTHLGVADLNALVLVGCFAAALTWFCLFEQASRVGLAVLAAGGVLALAVAVSTRAVFGAEIVGNFFFSQMAGEGFAVAALCLGQPLLARSRWTYAAYATVASFLGGCFHLIPALHFALGASALIGLEGLRRLVAERRLDPACLVGIAGSLAAIVANPGFWAMRRVSTNDGTVGYLVELSFTQLAAAELGLLLFSAWVLLALVFRRGPLTPADRASALIAALGAAAAAAALVQILSLVELGESSTYAVKKHAFGIFTLLCFVIPVWAAQLARAARPAPRWALGLVLLGQFWLASELYLRPSILDVAQTDALIRAARDLRLARHQDRTDILFASARVRPLVSYVVGSASLRRRRDEASLEVLQTGFPLHLERLPHIATEVGGVFDHPDCREGPPLHDLVVVRGACAILPALSFRSGAGAAYLKTGWSRPEAGGVWSVGPLAMAEIPLPDTSNLRQPWVEVSAFAYLPAKSPSRTVTVRIDGGAADRFVFVGGKALSHAFALPLSPADVAAGKVRLLFEVDDPVAPASVGEGDDTRPLGVGLEQIRVLPKAG